MSRENGSGVATPGKCGLYLLPTGCSPTGDDQRWIKGGLVNYARRREPAGETGLPFSVFVGVRG